MTHDRVYPFLARIGADRVRLLSLSEQALISGGNFAVLLLLARAFDETAFGLFSFAWLTLLFVVNLHRSAVVVPFVIHAAEPGTLAAEGEAWKRLNRLAVLVFILLPAGAALVATPLGAPAWMATALLVAAAWVAPGLTYEFRRRWLIQLDRYGAALGAALVYALLQLGCVAAALALGRIEVAMAGVAVANGGAALVCVAAAPRLPRPAEPLRFPAFLGGLSHFIGWSLASNFAFNVYAHMPPLVLGALAGPVPVAVYQAMRNFAQPLYTLLTAIDNFDKPRAARATAAEGLPGLRRALGATTAAMAGLSAPYLLLLALFGGTVVQIFYGHRYDSQAHVLWWFIGAHLATLAAYPVETALMLLRRPDLLFAGRVVAAAAGAGLSVLLIPAWGLPGAMAALIGGVAVSGLAAGAMLLRPSATRRTRA